MDSALREDSEVGDREVASADLAVAASVAVAQEAVGNQKVKLFNNIELLVK